MNKNKQIKTAILLFLILILLELLIFLIIKSLPNELVWYSTPCSVPDFLHPFGNYRGGCVQVLALGQKYAGLHYQLIWLMLILAFAYLVYLVRAILVARKKIILPSSPT